MNKWQWVFVLLFGLFYLLMTWSTAKSSAIFFQAVAYGKLITLPRLEQAGQESRQPPATLEHNQSPFICIYKIAARQCAFEWAFMRLPKNTPFFVSLQGKKKSHRNLVLPSVTIPPLCMPCNVKSDQDTLHP